MPGPSNYPPGVTGNEDYFQDGDRPLRRRKKQLPRCPHCRRAIPFGWEKCATALAQEGFTTEQINAYGAARRRHPKEV